MKRTLFLNRMVRPYTRIFDISVTVAAIALFLLILNSKFQTDELNNHMLINQPLVQLENYLVDMDNLAQNAMTNVLLIRKFSDLREEGDPENHFAKDILDAIETSSILRNITGVRSDIFRIAAFNDRGDFVSSGTVVNMRDAENYLKKISAEEKMQDFAAGEYEYILAGPALDHWSTTFKSDYLSLIRPIMNVYSRDVVGIVEVQKNKETLISSVYLDETSQKKINIYNEKGDPVYLQEADIVNYRVVGSVTSHAFGWRIDLLENKNIFTYWLIRMFLSVTAGSLIIIFLVRNLVGRITRQVALPLENLKRSVESIDVTNPTRVDTENLDIEEVYSVANSFNTLMENTTFLMAQEKKAYLFALQAQMNPHFLYNVLSIINAAAIEGNPDTVIDIVGNLSDMLRYSSSFENSVAKLEDEVRYARQYLKIMKARYTDNFTYQIEMEDSVKNEIVSKLVIQPLFENCFQHGFADIEPPYRIQAWIKAEKDGWSVEVRDNGKGFSRKEKKSLLAKVEEVELADLSDMQIGGLGVLSSIVRTRIVTGKKVTCEITDLSPKGAGIKIKVFSNNDNKE